MKAPSKTLKKPKVEEEENGEEVEETTREEQEEAFLALIEHRTREVEHLRKRVSYYQSELAQAEKRLEDSQSKLARLRGQQIVASPSGPVAISNGHVKVEHGSTSPLHINEGSKSQAYSRTELVIPSVNQKISQPLKSVGSAMKAISGSGGEENPSSSSKSATKVNAEKSARHSSNLGVAEMKDRGAKRKFEQKEHKELIPLIRKASSPCTVHCHASTYIPSQHKRKLRGLALCPVNDQLFVTSALDGNIKLWQIQSRGSSASSLRLDNCTSPGQRWPEDIAWHPQGDCVFSTYAADSGDSQISILKLNTQGKGRVTFLEDKPHSKGIINSIAFMPWENTCFVTGGSDHAVVLWSERDVENSWKPKTLHKNLHSSAVMGVAGMQEKQIVLSAGADKRIVGFDVHVGRADFKHQIDSKCMSVLPNPCDFNLFIVQAGTHEKQLRLFDIRLRQTEIHAFGWKQESSDSHSALINQAWSPDGLYLTSGSADPVIHIFDIRYNAQKPSQSITAHQKRVFKAEWHSSLPLLISISSDLTVGLHKI
ncbi:hypothetical protein SLE2022_369950 [Rubroshorea leprosula]